MRPLDDFRNASGPDQIRIIRKVHTEAIQAASCISYSACSSCADVSSAGLSSQPSEAGASIAACSRAWTNRILQGGDVPGKSILESTSVSGGLTG